MKHKMKDFIKQEVCSVSIWDDEGIIISRGSYSVRTFYPGSFNIEHRLSPGAPCHRLVR